MKVNHYENQEWKLKNSHHYSGLFFQVKLIFQRGKSKSVISTNLGHQLSSFCLLHKCAFCNMAEANPDTLEQQCSE